jgi:hypothetical protein
VFACGWPALRRGLQQSAVVHEGNMAMEMILYLVDGERAGAADSAVAGGASAAGEVGGREQPPLRVVLMR